MGTKPVAGRIFVSYRRDDSAYATGWLTDRLTDHYGADQVFTDVDSIELGDDFVRRITDAVSSCDVLLAVIGRNWLTVTDGFGRRRLDDVNDYVRIEIEAALRRHVLVIPILVDGATMPGVFDLPGRPKVPGAEPEPCSLASLTRREALSLTPNQFDWAVDRLLGKLDKVLLSSGLASNGKPTNDGPDNGDPSPGRHSDVVVTKGRWTAVGLLAAAVAVLLVATPWVVTDVAGARSRQLPDASTTPLWLAPAVPAALGAWLLLRTRVPTLGVVGGCCAMATWLVALSWTVLAERNVDQHVGVHALLLVLLLGATGVVAATPQLRERMVRSPLATAVLACCLTVMGFLLRTQAKPVGDAVGSGDGLELVHWGLNDDKPTFWVALAVPFAVCLTSAVAHGNREQTRLLRTFVGAVVLYGLVVATLRAANDVVTGEMDLALLLETLLAALGLLLWWGAVRVSQPKPSAATWASAQPTAAGTSF